jgi:hypothetical protein
MYTYNQVVNTSTTPNAAAETPQPQPGTPLTPEVIVDQLRGIRSQIQEVAPLNAKQRLHLRNRLLASNEVLQASINAIGASPIVSQAVGQAEDVRGLHEESNRWTAVEDELRSLLNGVAGANLIRRQRLAMIAGQTFQISKQLVRDPANAQLVPHVEEIQRLKGTKRRKKAAPPSQTPSPNTPAPNAPAQGTPAPSTTAPQHA